MANSTDPITSNTPRHHYAMKVLNGLQYCDECGKPNVRVVEFLTFLGYEKDVCAECLQKALDLLNPSIRAMVEG